MFVVFSGKPNWAFTPSIPFIIFLNLVGFGAAIHFRVMYQTFSFIFISLILLKFLRLLKLAFGLMEYYNRKVYYDGDGYV